MGKANGAERMLADCNLLKTKLKLIYVNKFLLGETVIDVCTKKHRRINVASFNKLWPLC